MCILSQPCPFCGEMETLKPILLDNDWKQIGCIGCGARGPMSKNGLEANRLWDSRKGHHAPEGGGR